MIGGGEMGDLVRDTDWSSTALGDYSSWPASLRTALSLVLNTKGIEALYWGPQQWLLYNDAYGLALGDRHPAAFGRPMPEVLTDIAPVLSPQVAQVLATGDGFSIENLSMMMRRHGKEERPCGPTAFRLCRAKAAAMKAYYRWISWSTQPDEHQINAVGRDFTAERESASALAAAEEALRQSQKLEAIGQLTGGVAHDFNNLLTVIKSSTDLLKRPDLSSERRARYVSAIADTVERAAKVTSQLLAFARRQTLQPTVFAPAENLRALASMIKTLVGAEVELVMNIPEHSHFVIADPSQFDMAIVNMAVNARDAMAGQGRLIIRVGPARRGSEANEQPMMPGDQVVISMTDTGSGIAPLHLDRIFEPFFTTKGVGQGTGLGLSQAFGFAKQSGGEITVASEVNQGTTFTLYLPQASEPREPRSVEATHELVHGHGTGVLIVEDNPQVGAFAMHSLTDLGYQPVLAINGQEALAELARDASRFKVVFSDVVMPGMTGIELAHEIRRRYAGLPVVLTSGYSHVLAEKGTDGFELLHKPYSVEQLSRLLCGAVCTHRSKVN